MSLSTSSSMVSSSSNLSKCYFYLAGLREFWWAWFAVYYYAIKLLWESVYPPFIYRTNIINKSDKTWLEFLLLIEIFAYNIIMLFKSLFIEYCLALWTVIRIRLCCSVTICYHSILFKRLKLIVLYRSSQFIKLELLNPLLLFLLLELFTELVSFRAKFL
jgi:hypothetical protein